MSDSPHRPAKLGDLLAQLFATRGYGRVEATRQLSDVWKELVGPLLFAQTKLGGPRRGTLEVRVANSVLLQELTFRQQELLERFQREIPEAKVARIKFRVGLS